MVSCGEHPRSDYFRRCVPSSTGADLQQAQTAEERHNTDIFRAGKMCGLRLVAGLWYEQPEQKQNIDEETLFLHITEKLLEQRERSLRGNSFKI